MPIDRNKFEAFKNTSAANQACLQRIGLACLQVAKPVCPVDTGYLKNSHRMEFDADNVTVGVTAEYGAAVHNGTARRPEGDPWLRKSISENRDSICALGVEEWKGNIGL